MSVSLHFDVFFLTLPWFTEATTAAAAAAATATRTVPVSAFTLCIT